MAQPSNGGEYERTLRDIATNGVFTFEQYRETGLSRHSLYTQARKGRVVRLQHGVYSIEASPSIVQFAQAAVLASGVDSYVSHLSAAALWGLIELEAPHPIALLRRSGSGYKGQGVHVRVSPNLVPEECTMRHGIPVTTVPRTLLDVASWAPARFAEQVTGAALRTSVLSIDELHATIRRHPRARGVERLRRLFELVTNDEVAWTRSRAEERFLRLVVEGNLPMPQVNQSIQGFEVDFYWPRHKVAVEVDGWAYHNDLRSFERDRKRDRVLKAAGVDVLRVTWKDLTKSQIALAAQLSSVLKQREMELCG